MTPEIRRLIQRWRTTDAEDAKARGYLETWNTYQVCANALEAALLALPADRPLPEAPTNPPNLADAAEMLWTVVANVSGGDWTQQSQDWQEAAARWRDNYFAAMKSGAVSLPIAVDPVPESGTDGLRATELLSCPTVPTPPAPQDERGPAPGEPPPQENDA
jgi:hypothetical protein